MNFKLHLVLTLFSLFTACNTLFASASDAPNILIFVGDDMTYRDCGPYGNADMVTPNIDRFASEGMCFDSMYTSTAMCVPTRAQLWSGMYPVRGGCYPNHSQLYDEAKPLSLHLKELGYRVGAMGKKGSNPTPLYEFDWTSGMLKPETIEEARQFIQAPADQPYMLWVGSNQPHTPYNTGDRSLYPADEITVPPYMADTPETRAELVKYYAEISELDREFGLFLEFVEDSGKADNTIVIFTSEQGSSIPFGGKWSCYENGLKTAWIMRWPGKIKPGTRTSAQTQYVDFAPTMIEIAGGDPTKASAGIPDADGKITMDGKSFLSVMTGKSKKLRNHVFGCHTTIGVAGATEEGYGIRSISDGKYKLIVNLQNENTFSCANARPNNQPLKSWREADDTWANQRAAFYVNRPHREFYKIKADPYELENLIDKRKHAKRIAKLQSVLDEWMRQQGDLGIETELNGQYRLQRYIRSLNES